MIKVFIKYSVVARFKILWGVWSNVHPNFAPGGIKTCISASVVLNNLFVNLKNGKFEFYIVIL
jgi:hypothetical protein